jgi:hypothetical protein
MRGDDKDDEANESPPMECPLFPAKGESGCSTLDVGCWGLRKGESNLVVECISSLDVAYAPPTITASHNFPPPNTVVTADKDYQPLQPMGIRLMSTHREPRTADELTQTGPGFRPFHGQHLLFRLCLYQVCQDEPLTRSCLGQTGAKGARGLCPLVVAARLNRRRKEMNMEMAIALDYLLVVQPANDAGQLH